MKNTEQAELHTEINIVKKLRKRFVSVTCYLGFTVADDFKEVPGKTHGDKLEFLIEFYNARK